MRKRFKRPKIQSSPLPKVALKEKQRTLAFQPIPPQHEGMPSDHASLQALKNLLTETDLLISTTDPLRTCWQCDVLVLIGRPI